MRRFMHDKFLITAIHRDMISGYYWKGIGFGCFGAKRYSANLEDMSMTTNDNKIYSNGLVVERRWVETNDVRCFVVSCLRT